MNPPAILSNHRAIGPALVLHQYLAAHTTPGDDTWLLVAGGNWISDTQIAFKLDVAESTARRWRKRLERLGHMCSELMAPRHRRMWIRNEHASSRQQAFLQAVPSRLVN